jgi:hypothetical protein
MRVRHVSVKGLFGVFDHEIPLQDEGRITIIHGMNGVGKTIVLKMVEEALTGKCDLLVTVPYERFELRFEDASTLRVEASGGRNARRLVFRLASADGHEEISGDQVSFDLDKERPSPRHAMPWLLQRRRLVDVRLVDIDRHVRVEEGQDLGMARLMPIVNDYSTEIARTIEAKRSEYAGISQELDQSFPARVLSRNGLTPYSPTELRRRLVGLAEKHDKLSSLGILSLADMIRDVPEEIDSSTLHTLSIYVKDTEIKLGSFDDLAAKIDTLTELVNHRFQFKRFVVRRGRGFVFTANTGGDVPVLGLSSGEQHELIMLYELLFRTKPDTLVLIDEPEISLHLAWQQRFLDDIERIVKLTNIDVLIATHSADIIDRHWDWTVALEGPANDP